jgi:hypothetical protein
MSRVRMWPSIARKAAAWVLLLPAAVSVGVLLTFLWASDAESLTLTEDGATVARKAGL